MKNDWEAGELSHYSVEHVECQWRRNELTLLVASALLRSELVGTVRSTDRDCEAVAASASSEVDNFLRVGVGVVVRRNLVLNAGKHLISQKPAATTVDNLTLQIETARRNNVRFACVPIHMMTPDMLMAQQIIRDGGIGDVLSVKCVSTHGGPEYFQYRDADPSWFYEPGAGALYDMGVHALDKVVGIMGPAKSVSCLAANARKRRTVRSGKFDGKLIASDKMPDTYFISLDFGNDRIAFVDTGFTQIATKCPPLEIYGSKGVISFKPHGGVWPNPDVYIDSPELGLRGWVTPQTWTASTRNPAHFTQCCCLYDLIQAIENDAEPILSPYRARHVLEITCATPEAIHPRAAVDLHTTF